MIMRKGEIIYVVVVVALFVGVVITHTPAYNDCRATNRSVGTCLLQIRY